MGGSHNQHLVQMENWGAEDCEQEITRIRPLLKLVRNQTEKRRLLEAITTAIRRKVTLELTQKVSTVPRLTENAIKDGIKFRFLINQRAWAANGTLVRVFNVNDAADSLVDGDRMANLLEPLVNGFLVSFDQSSAPPEVRPHLERAAERVVFSGLRVHCLCVSNKKRNQCTDIMGLEKLYDEWNFKSLTAFIRLRGYDRHNRGIPMLIFNAVFDSEVEPIQKQLRLGWWRRMKNRNKFRNLFESGILLGILYDLESNERIYSKSLEGKGG